uniref:Pilus assembly protein n=1 Tax=Schlesneria paludicola TaxID=360056 RepID=A0A7C2JZA9_9PLAN
MNARTHRGPQTDRRRGAAAVECAIVMPVMVALVLGLIQGGYSVDTTHKLYAAVRQAGRLAGMNYRPLLKSGQTGNDKVIQDIRNTLAAEGLPADQLTITITEAEGGGTFNLDDPANDLKLFRISASVPYSALSTASLLPAPVETLSASIVFRKGRSQVYE